MNRIIVKSTDELGKAAADIFEAEIRKKPDLVLGLATGSTPLPLYKELIDRYKAGVLDFSKVRTVNLDEYVGLPPEHDQSYRYFMDENLFNHINIDKANTNVPNGISDDPAAECERYEALIESMGGIDLQLLGVGLNGHLGFNEPDDVFVSKTQVIKLTNSTINANARFFASADEVPKYAITMGIKQIMLARKIVLVAGAEKQEIVNKALHGNVTPQIPVSILQLHRDAAIINVV